MRWISRVSLVLLLAVGSWQLSEGLYMDAKASLSQVLLQKAWSETGERGEGVRPWPWADTWPVARLSVERLGIDQVVLSGASGRTLAFGPGHIDGTAMPGSRGNSVISGHRDTHFNFLQSLEKGDQIEVTSADGGKAQYAVIHMAVHHEGDTWLLKPSSMRLTLVTCFPFDALVPGGEERYVVIAEPILI